MINYNYRNNNRTTSAKSSLLRVLMSNTYGLLPMAMTLHLELSLPNLQNIKNNTTDMNDVHTGVST